MSTTAVVLLGIIAAATLVMAIIQVGLIVVAARLARKVDLLGQQLQQDIRPLLGKAQAVADNAQRAAGLALAQVERADRLFADLTRRAEDGLTLVQSTLQAPAREGRALLTGVVAAVSAYREMRAARARAAGDEDDPLFIG